MRTKKQRIALIDGDTLVYASAFAVEKTTDWGDGTITLHADEDEAKQTIQKAILEIVTELKPDSYHIALTCHGTPNFRKAFYPQYKENRTVKRKPLAWKCLREYLISDYDAQIKANLEADDVLGIWATKLWPGNPERVIASIDKDFKTIPGSLYNPKSKTLVKITQREAESNFLMQVLTGDSTDNYPGCPGVGPKKAEAILTSARSHATSPEDEFTLMWAAILKAYQAKGIGPADVLIQARCARILQAQDYDFSTKQPILWEAPHVDDPNL
jgi:DNA polymerase-1